jgi:actin-related protein 3
MGREVKAGRVRVKVVEHKRQQYAVWYGGAMLAMTGKAFFDQCLTKQAYDEVGPSIARRISDFLL